MQYKLVSLLAVAALAAASPLIHEEAEYEKKVSYEKGSIGENSPIRHHGIPGEHDVTGHTRKALHHTGAAIVEAPNALLDGVATTAIVAKDGVVAAGEVAAGAAHATGHAAKEVAVGTKDVTVATANSLIDNPVTRGIGNGLSAVYNKVADTVHGTAASAAQTIADNAQKTADAAEQNAARARREERRAKRKAQENKEIIDENLEDTAATVRDSVRRSKEVTVETANAATDAAAKKIKGARESGREKIEGFTESVGEVRESGREKIESATESAKNSARRARAAKLEVPTGIAIETTQVDMAGSLNSDEAGVSTKHGKRGEHGKRKEYTVRQNSEGNIETETAELEPKTVDDKSGANTFMTLGVSSAIVLGALLL